MPFAVSTFNRCPLWSIRRTGQSSATGKSSPAAAMVAP
jgi:hypothetical protein